MSWIDELKQQQEYAHNEGLQEIATAETKLFELLTEAITMFMHKIGFPHGEFSIKIRPDIGNRSYQIYFSAFGAETELAFEPDAVKYVGYGKWLRTTHKGIPAPIVCASELKLSNISEQPNFASELMSVKLYSPYHKGWVIIRNHPFQALTVHAILTNQITS